MSTNPYAQSPAGAPAPAASSEQQRASDYELAVGPNNDYYLPKFEQFDQGGSTAGWHWPAFFATSPWFLYRKMYGPGVFILLYPLIALILCAIIYGILRPSTNVMIAIGILVFAAPWFLFPIYANALYWKHIKKVIRNVPSSFASQPDKRAARIERNGGTAVGPMIGILAGLGFFGIGGIGIMAAIAIPAYQDYTIRSQIYEGLNLASAPKAAVAEYYVSNGEWPADSETAGLDSIGGKFVESVVIESGQHRHYVRCGGQRENNATAPGLAAVGGCGGQRVLGVRLRRNARRLYTLRRPLGQRPSRKVPAVDL